MADITIEQALFHRPGDERPRLLARSRAVLEEWLAEAEELIQGFGERPPGLEHMQAVFAHPLGKDQVAVVQLCDQSGVTGTAMAFHFLMIARAAYERLFGDPFLLARRLPADWNATALTGHVLPAEPLSARRIEDVQRVLKRIKAGALREDQEPHAEPEYTPENSESPALLGGVQVLVDGGRVVFERPTPDTGLIPDLWTLLPTSTRGTLWPASYAFSNALGFDALVVARAAGENFNGYTSEEQAAEYPAGRYEYNLQVAAESGDQGALDQLLRRRSWAETWKLGLTILALAMALAVVGRVLDVLNPPGPQPAPVHKNNVDKEKP